MLSYTLLRRKKASIAEEHTATHDQRSLKTFFDSETIQWIYVFLILLSESLGGGTKPRKNFLRYHCRVIGDCLHDFWTRCSSISGSGLGCVIMSSKGACNVMLELRILSAKNSALAAENRSYGQEQ